VATVVGERRRGHLVHRARLDTAVGSLVAYAVDDDLRTGVGPTTPGDQGKSDGCDGQQPPCAAAARHVRAPAATG
jgi:hypothetical protein